MNEKEQIKITVPTEDVNDIKSTSLEEIRMKRAQRRRKRMIKNYVTLGIIAALILGIAFGVIGIKKYFDYRNEEEKQQMEQERKEKEKAEKLALEKEAAVSEAEFLAAGYDYDKAIEIIKSIPGYDKDPGMTNAISRYESTKATMVRHKNVSDITHIFFHTLIVDTSLAFDGDYEDAGYNQYMTTVTEFNRMMEEMYKRGYVLVDIHDIAREEMQEDGTVKFVPGDIYLPEGKIPFVMSQDDVSYYNYMAGDGFATKIVIGEDGYPTNEYINPDGSVVYGDYDLVTLLESFIQKHPDFSYRGARAALALTGYDGVLGYRTSPTGDGYKESDIAEAKKVADRMRELGWTFASHSWGHQKYGQISLEKMIADATRWENEVRPIVGDTDVLIYANGADIAGIESYSGEKYEYLKGLGFKYFCNVDSSKAWVQIRNGYVRQGRRNLDGYRMYHSPKRLEDLFNVEDVWDDTRPVPVPSI